MVVRCLIRYVFSVNNLLIRPADVEKPPFWVLLKREVMPVENGKSAVYHQVQMKKAWQTVAYACRYSSFWARHLQPVMGRYPAVVPEFSALPFMDSKMLVGRGEQMLCVSSGEIARIRTFSTSGSTGEPKRMFFDRQDLESTIEFFARGMAPVARAGGLTLIMMSDEKPDSIGRLLKEGLRRRGRRSIIYGRPKTLLETVRAASRADCLVGFPADLFYLCRKAPGLRPDSVLLSADYIAPALVAALKAEWGSRVFCHYGLTETGYGLAVQCGAGAGMHLRHERFMVEIIDPETLKPLPPGGKGEITLTSLEKSALPLIRYRTGDIGRLSVGRCGCGSDAPRLDRVYGRGENLKQRINIHYLDDVLYGLPGLAAYRAELAGGVLKLAVDGPQLPEEKIAELVKCPVALCHDAQPPWEPGGKRNLGQISEIR